MDTMWMDMVPPVLNNCQTAAIEPAIMCTESLALQLFICNLSFNTLSIFP